MRCVVIYYSRDAIRARLLDDPSDRRLPFGLQPHDIDGGEDPHLSINALVEVGVDDPMVVIDDAPVPLGEAVLL